MTGATLPDSEQEFLSQLKTYFPKHWDMKFIMGKKNIHGGLQKVRLPPRACHATVPSMHTTNSIQLRPSLLWNSLGRDRAC